MKYQILKINETKIIEKAVKKIMKEEIKENLEGCYCEEDAAWDILCEMSLDTVEEDSPEWDDDSYDEEIKSLAKKIAKAAKVELKKCRAEVKALMKAMGNRYK